MHAAARPSLAELAAAFPRHPPYSVRSMAHQLGLREAQPQKSVNEKPLVWLRIAHTHFAKREAEMRA